jgi:hypothetical protein
MCWSKEVSLLTFLIGTISSYTLYQFNQPMLKLYAYFFMFVTLMQGVEFFLWSHQICDDLHKQISITGMFLNLIQPVVLAILTLYFNGGKSILALISICIGYLIGIRPFIQYYLQDEQLQCTTPKCGDPHLVWNWTILPHMNLAHFLYLGALSLIALVGFPDRASSFMFTFVTLVSYTLSRLLYSRAVFGSMWCWYVVFVPSILLSFHTFR